MRVDATPLLCGDRASVLCVRSSRPLSIAMSFDYTDQVADLVLPAIRWRVVRFLGSAVSCINADLDSRNLSNLSPEEPLKSCTRIGITAMWAGLRRVPRHCFTCQDGRLPL